jgi:hypothetical protein
VNDSSKSTRSGELAKIPLKPFMTKDNIMNIKNCKEQERPHKLNGEGGGR